MTSLNDRNVEPELMDDPALDAGRHRQALRGLGRVNRLSGTSTRIASRILKHFSQGKHGPDTQKGPIRILDVASGGGDVTIGVARKLQHEFPDAEFVGWDISQTAIHFSNEKAAKAGVSNISFHEQDALAVSRESAKRFDCVYCTLFLHHLQRPQAVQLLRTMSLLSKSLVIVDDLLRSRLGYWLALAGCRFLSRSPIVWTDGPMSVRAAFRKSEFLDVCREASVTQIQWEPHWPQRFMASWVPGKCEPSNEMTK